MTNLMTLISYLDFFMILFILFTLLSFSWMVKEILRPAFSGPTLHRTQFTHFRWYVIVWLILIGFWIPSTHGSIVRYDAYADGNWMNGDHWALQAVMQRVILGVFWVFLGFTNAFRAWRKGEIRETGFSIDEGFVPWHRLLKARWLEDCRLELTISHKIIATWHREIRRTWKVHPSHVQQVQDLFDRYAPKEALETETSKS